MASYKQACIHCGKLVDHDASFCPYCYHRSPFAYRCPSCLKEIDRSQPICPGCGRPLYVPCPHCQQMTFVGDRCDQCGGILLIPCPHKGCGDWQFFQNVTCTACGRPLGTQTKKKKK